MYVLLYQPTFTRLVFYSFQIQVYRRKTRKRMIVTLDPNKLAEKKQECLDISGRKSFRPYTLLLEQSRAVKVNSLHYESGLKRDESPHASYPPDTKGFLYYSMLPGRPRIAGEIRFRVTSSDDPASFESGSDLLRANGLPWFRPLCVLSKIILPLYEKLKEEQFIPDDLDKVLLNFPSVRLRYRTSQILYTLNDTFIIDFSRQEFNLFAITEQGAKDIAFDKTFHDVRGIYNRSPYTGAYTDHHLSILLL
jgi:hypothetical protein